MIEELRSILSKFSEKDEKTLVVLINKNRNLFEMGPYEDQFRHKTMDLLTQKHIDIMSRVLTPVELTKFLINCSEDSLDRDSFEEGELFKDESCDYRILAMAFNWDVSNEGEDYWISIFDRISVKTPKN